MTSIARLRLYVFAVVVLLFLGTAVLQPGHQVEAEGQVLFQAPGYASNPPPGSFINLTTTPGVPVIGTIAVTESGTGTLNILSIAISNPTNFTLTTPGTFSISDGGTAQNIIIQCNAPTAGTFVSAVTVTHNAPGTPATYTFTCTAALVNVTPTITPIPATPTPAPPANTSVSNEVKGLAVRTGPYLGATLIGSAFSNQSYPVLARSNDEGGEYTWYLIQLDGFTGWASGRFLSFPGDPNLLPAAGSVFDQIDGAPDTGVTAELLAITDVRRRPSGRAQIIRTLPPNVRVAVIGRTRQNGGNFWLHIRYEGQVGWIPAYVQNVRGSWSNVPIR